MRRRILFGLIACLGFTGAAGLFHVARNAFVEASNHRQLDEIVTQVVARTEVAVDLAVIRLGELMAAGHTGCDVESLVAMRRAAFTVGSVKDIVVLDEGGGCSGFAEIGLVDLASARDERRYAARNRNIALLAVAEPDWRGLGVAWSLGGRDLVALMSTDALLFDMLPGPLREHAAIDLTLAPGVEVARYAPMAWTNTAGADVSDTVVFTAASARYPLFVRIAVERSALAVWNRAVHPWLTVAGGLFAAVFGLLLARATLPPRNETDAIDDALARGAIVPFVQPIVSLATHRTVGVEILARWIERDGTHVSPARFIPLVETTGRSDRLMEALLRSLGGSLGPLLTRRPDLKVAVNAVPDQFAADGFAQRFVALVESAGLPVEGMVVEITERREIGSPEAARATVAELRAAGIGVAIDDAGTGHNGLAAIQGLGATTLKIDKLFVDRIDTDARTRSLVEMLVQVAREFEMTLVAEGIERPEQAVALLAIGVRQGQGFLFARPMPAADFIAYIEAEEARSTADAPHGRLRLSA